MSCANNLWPVSSCSLSPVRGSAMVVGACLWIVLCGLTACDRVGGSRYSQLTQDADSKSAQGDFLRAIDLYEAALDDSPRCAEIHYKLAVLYDDKMNDPLNALHHFKRYLVLSPNGAHASDVKNSVKRAEIAVVTSLSGDSVVTRAEAARLRNENLNLHKELEARSAPLPIGSGKAQTRDASSKKTASRKSEGRTYDVRSGDTLVSISRKFYKSSTRWKAILDATKQEMRDPKKLTV